MTTRSSFFPSHSRPLCDAHRHWLVQDGENVPDLQASLPNLTIYAQALALPLPPDPTHASYWLDASRFETAVYTLISHFGRETPKEPVDKKASGRQGMETWSLDVVGMQKATGVAWPEWSQWVEMVEKDMPRMVQCCLSVGLTPPDWFLLFWRTAIDVRREIGFRLRIVEELDGRTFWDDFVSGLEAHPGRLAKADILAQRLACSNMLSELLASGAVSSDGMLLWVKPFRRDVYPLMRFLGIEPGSHEANLWDSYEWGLWEQPLVREAVRLRGLRTDYVVQSPYLVSSPVDGNPDEYWAALKVAMTVRSARQNVGVKLLEMRMRSCNSSLKYSENDGTTEPLDNSYLQQDMKRISEVRDVILDSMVKLQKGIMTEASVDTRPTRIQSEELPTFLMLNAVQWYKEEENTGTASAVKVTVTDGDENEAEIGISGMVLGEMSTESDTATSAPNAPTSSPLSTYEMSVKKDIDSLLSEKTQVLYRLSSAIMLQIESGRKEDTSRPSGKDVKWMSMGLADETRERLVSEGFTKLRDVRGFGKDTVLDGYYSIGRLIEMYQDLAPSSALSDLMSSLSVWLAVTFISDSPWLYSSAGGHIVDDICGKLAAGQYGLYSERAPALFSAIGDLADGVFVGASIGSRTSQDRIYGSTATWIRNLLFPESCLLALPFGFGHRLQCSACFEDHIEISSDQPTSGLGGEIRSVNLKDRLSISVFCVRRGTTFDIMRATGRTSAYDCLACLLVYFFHPSFIITFLYFASVIHMRDKAARGKYTVILGKDGYQLL